MVHSLLPRLGAAIALAAALVATAATEVRGQGGDSAAAEVLFREARELMKKKRFEQACPKLEESQRLDPGVGTLANLALCYEKTNRLASAWASYREAADEAKRRGQKKRAREASKRADALEKRLHRVAITVPRRSRIDGLTIKRDGALVGEGSYGVKVPVNQGKVLIEASAPGHRRWTTTIIVESGRRLRVIDIPRLKKEPKVAPPPPGDDDDDDGELRELGPRPAWYADPIAWGLVGGGVVLAAGGAFGALPHASGLATDAENAPTLEESDDLDAQATLFRGIGIGLVAGGGAMLVAGAVKLALRPAAEPIEAPAGAAVIVGPRSIGIFIRF